MSDIKSARELAMAKVNAMEQPSEEERLSWKYVPEGEKIAARYLKQEAELVNEINKFEAVVVKYVTRGAADVLTRNISLPKNDIVRKNNKLAMDGIKAVKEDKVAVENILSRIRRVFAHYLEQGEQQRKQAYASLKANFEAKIRQALQQQYGSVPNVKIDVESQPQFQEEWRKMQAQLDSQYLKLLEEYRQELTALK